MEYKIFQLTTSSEKILKLILTHSFFGAFVALSSMLSKNQQIVAIHSRTEEWSEFIEHYS